MKTIFIVSKKADFSASRLMSESGLKSFGYICCGSYKVYETTDENSIFLGIMDATEVIQHIKQDEKFYKVEEVKSESTEDNFIRYTDEPKVFYISARPLYE